MKLLILSDCHANVDALRAVWEREKDCDYLLFAGDMVDYGFYPKETVEWFMQRKEKLFAVRGNHDEWILAHRTDPQPTNPMTNFQSHTFSELEEEHYDFLTSIPHEITFTLGETDFYMCHTPDELTDEVFFVEQQMSNLAMCHFFDQRFREKFPHASSPRRIIVYGHSHLQWAASAGEGQWICNPGSLSYRFGSFEPTRCADYLVWEDGDFGLRHVNFDTQDLYAKADQLEDLEAARLARAFYRKKGEGL